MKRFYLFKDGVQKGRMETRAEALEMIRLWQSRETHSFLRAEFSIIEGEEEIITGTASHPWAVNFPWPAMMGTVCAALPSVAVPLPGIWTMG